MKIWRWKLALLGSIVCLAVACSDDSPAESALIVENNAEADAGQDASNNVAQPDGGQNTEEDVVTVGDDVQGGGFEGHRCGTTPIEEWPLHAAVTSAQIQAAQADGVFTATIDASAGGSQASRNNPFIYLRLDTGEKVEISDVDSLTNSEWHVGFKRTVIRTNSEDSGPGGWALTKEPATTFEAVTSAPTEVSFYEVDRSFDELCAPILDPINQVVTAFNHLNRTNGTGSGSWYNYDGGVSPVAGDIYVLRHAGRNEAYKVELQSWSSGTYTIRWARLN